MKIILTAVWLALICTGICLLFWHTEWKYNLPTPVPINYHEVPVGTFIPLDEIKGLKKEKPVLLHFFNPACPCSRFNIEHVRSLIKLYKDRMSIAVVVISDDKSLTERDIQNKFQIDVPIFFNRSIAGKCGVYSTPQAVIIDDNGKLFYRGNYNRSRYCADEKSNYAQMAIDSLLAKKYHIAFAPVASKSYGCSFPNCKK